MNPFLSAYTTIHGVPPFEQIEFEHFAPAFQQGFAEQVAEYEAIEQNPESPTFENTIAALERSGATLSRVARVFYSLLGTDSTPELSALAKDIGAQMASHRNRLYLSQAMFERINTLHHNPSSDWTEEQRRLVEDRYKKFAKSGVQLPDEQRDRLRALDAEIATLTSEFRDNLLQESNDATVLITDEADLLGVSPHLIDGAAKAASEKGLEGWLFTANRITLYPFLTTAESREHRRQLYHAYTHRGCNGNEQDNRKLAERVATLRVEKSNILGYDCYAEYALEDAMAKTPEQVLSFLDQIWAASSYSANEEAKALTEYLERDGVEGPLEAWDWWYYAEKVRVEQFDLSEDEVRPYFSLENVVQGAFNVASRLFNIDFVERTDMPIYHPDVRVFEVQHAESKEVMGVFYADYFARPSKRGGAWMSSFQVQHNLDRAQIPIVINVCNFPPPTADKPSLLSSGHVKTLFHELGHALHGLLSAVDYPTMSGTNVVMDYVEFPSQLMENWGNDPAVIREYARHYQTGEPMPQELMDKMAAAGNFNQGFMTSEYLAASYLDLAWHMQTGPSKSTEEIEQQVIDRIGLRPQIGFRYRSTYFAHIFAGGYASFYYCYIWAAVLEKDAYALFEERGLFDRETAGKLLDHVYSKGNSKDSMGEYRKFRGSEPKVDALIEKRGLGAH